MYINNDENQNYIRPAKDPRQSLITAALVLGGLSIVSTIMMTVYLPFILGGIGIILAILSKGQDLKMEKHAKTGMLLSIAGVILNICIIFGAFYTVFHNPEVNKEFNQVFEQMYGESFDDMLEDFRNGEQPEYFKQFDA